MTGALLTGAVLTETIFSWPGIGHWLVKGTLSRDYPVITGGVFSYGFYYCGGEYFSGCDLRESGPFHKGSAVKGGKKMKKGARRIYGGGGFPQRFLKMMKRDPLFLLCLLGILFVFTGSYVAPWLSGHSPYTVHGEFLTLPPRWMEGGNPRFFLGTDDLGRDLTARLFHGGRISLMAGGAVMLLSLIFGLIFGALSALFQKKRNPGLWERWIF